MNPNNIPLELRQRKQWVVWQSVLKDGKITKPPFQAARPQYGADVRNPAHFAEFDIALKCWQDNPSTISGIGFVFTEQDDLFGIDVDDEDKVKPENLAARKLLVKEIMSTVATYTELSTSGKGVHIIGRGKLPTAGTRNTALQVEVYGQDRYFTITGNVINGMGLAAKDAGHVADVLAKVAVDTSTDVRAVGVAFKYSNIQTAFVDLKYFSQ